MIIKTPCSMSLTRSGNLSYQFPPQELFYHQERVLIMSPRHRPDRQHDYPKSPQPGSETSPDKDRQRELDQHHPMDHPHPHPRHHPQKKTDPSPRHNAHSHPHEDDLPSHTNPPGPIKPSKKMTKTGKSSQ